ncbi:hypothetical protein [Mycetocola saprophilus]|uniref:hypothetical protein n=1 Tax=Mycetocola saprophilus TaxID=76636 RepID=UPI0005BD88D7|nr:hypothetical protein [Mycetocola saprophilus]
MFIPRYGETPLDFDELDVLKPAIRSGLGSELTKLAVFDVEQTVEYGEGQDLFDRALTGGLSLDHVLTVDFVRTVHHNL